MTTPALLCGGRFQLTKQLGEGGMAVVHQAYDHRLQVWRAVKTLNPDYAKRRKLRKRFLGEAQAMARLEHKNIVRVYDVGEEGPTVYIVMELVDGGALEDWLEKNQCMPPRLAIRCLLDVCDGIREAHNEGIIHRDIKPHNVLVDRHGVCKVTDFGIAQVKDTTGQMTRTGTVMGTLGFMAPEQRTDSKHIDERADVYSLGASLFTMITSRTSMDLFAAEQDDSILADVGAELKAVIGKATRYHPDSRYADVMEFAEAIRAVLPKLPPDPVDTPPLVGEARQLPPPPELPDEVDTTTFSTELGPETESEPTTGATEVLRRDSPGGQLQQQEVPVTAANRIRSGFEEEMPRADVDTLHDARKEQTAREVRLGEEDAGNAITQAVSKIIRLFLEYAVGPGFVFRFLLPMSIITIGAGVWLNLGAESVNLAEADFDHARSDFVSYVLTDSKALSEEMLAAGVNPGMVQSYRDEVRRVTAKKDVTLAEQVDTADRFTEAADSALQGIRAIDPTTLMKVKKARAHAKIMVDKRTKMVETLDAWSESTNHLSASTAIRLGLASAPPE